MKVVLFCGGLGTRLNDRTETIPKPMIEIGYRPLMWHLMRYYAHFGHREFILCLGYKGDYIKKYFLEYNESLSNDFELSKGGEEIRLFNSDIEDWKITFIDTGLNSNIGQRLLRVKQLLEGEDLFLANYADGLTNLDLSGYVQQMTAGNKVASFLSVKPSQSFHVVKSNPDGLVADITPVDQSDIWINGGFFVFKQEIFDSIREGEDLVREPFYRLILEDQLFTLRNPDFWACIDTLKEKRMFDDMFARGETPWMVWEQSNPTHKPYQIPENGKQPVPGASGIGSNASDLPEAKEQDQGDEVDARS